MDIEEIIKLVLKDADDKKQRAGYAGAMSDYGASNLRNQVKFYDLGRKGILPTEWEKYANQTDVEYQEYIRLKKKFEDRLN